MASLLLATQALAQDTTPAPTPPPAPAPAAPPTQPAVPTPVSPSPRLPASASPSVTPTTPNIPEAPPPNLSVPKAKISPLAPKPDWAKLSAFNDVLTRDEFEAAIKNIYSDEIGGPVPWKLGANSILVETTPGQKTEVITFREPSMKSAHLPRYWRRAEELPPLKPGEPVLSGLHIALDPGHIGGNYAHMEERWLSMNGEPPIMEGSLVLQVAMLLKPRLEALGAQVYLVRSQEGPVTTTTPEALKAEAKKVLVDAGVTQPKDSYDGISDLQRVATVQYQAEKLFYRVSEIRARADKVNKEFKPDLVLCLHLNAEEWHDPNHPTPSPNNHLHVMVNGCYASDELEMEDVRFEMLHRVFARISDEEQRLADPIAKAMAQATGLPPFTYITKNARRISANPYVYARNLLANRLYQCPVIYLEPYVMNHWDTYKRLLLGPYAGRTLFEGKLVSSPLEDYARGVTIGLYQYYQKARRTAEVE